MINCRGSLAGLEAHRRIPCFGGGPESTSSSSSGLGFGESGFGGPESFSSPDSLSISGPGVLSSLAPSSFGSVSSEALIQFKIYIMLDFNKNFLCT